MKHTIRDLVNDVVAAPLGDIIASVGEGVAEAQQALDEGSLAKTLEIYAEGGEDALKVLREIGYRPTFYALPETTGEIKISMHLGKSPSGTNTPQPRRQPRVLNGTTLQPAVLAQLARTGRNLSLKPRVYATPVDAGYANRYGYRANISATIHFKIVPVPAPEGADELRILPNLVGTTLRQSLAVAESIGLDINVIDSTGASIASPDETKTVATQEPSFNPDTVQIARLGDEVLVTLTP